MTDAITLLSPLAGWASALSAVPDPVFAEGMMGSGVAIDPIGGTLHAPCDGTVTAIHAACHAVTLTTDAGAEVLMHIGIDSVAMAGEGFERLVADGTRVEAGQALIRFDLDLLVQRARSAITPVLLVGEGFALTPLAIDRSVAVGDALVRLTRTGAAAADVAGEAAVVRTVTVALPHGIHARPAARIAAAVRGRDAVLTLIHGDARASALSMTALLGLGAARGTVLRLEASGSDADTATDAVAEILTATVDPDAPVAAPVAESAAIDVPAGALLGVCAVPGLAIGTVRWLHPAAVAAPAGSGDIDTERVALARAFARLKTALDGQDGVLAAHRAMLDDPALIAALDDAITRGEGAARAVLSVTRAQAEALAGNPDRRIAERAADLTDIGERLAHAILGSEADAIRLDPGTVLVADDLLPSQFAGLVATPPAAIALVRGGPTSHVAIMAAASGVPMVVALGAALTTVAEGAQAIVDGDGGTFLPTPDAAARDAAQLRIDRAHATEARMRGAANAGPTATRDGHRVAVQVNLGTAADAAAGVADGAEGCGLLRTELLFLDRTSAPTREEQASDYRRLARAMVGRPLTIRLLDIGGDKPAPYLAIAAEENPALGLRGVRVSLARPDVLETQLAAILDAADAGPCRIMIPMVTGVAEVAAVRAVLDRLDPNRGLQLGAMIETPAAAICADALAEHCDFLSIGSNDLTQYALAMDRGNAAVASGLDGLHPAVLRLIAATCEGGAKHGVPVGVCGGLAADPLAVPILIGLGVTSLSVPPVRIAATRALVADITQVEAVVHARRALGATSAAAVRTLARAFAEGHAA